MPIVAVFIGIYITGGFSKHYALATAIGGCLLFGHLVQRVTAGRLLPHGFLLALFAGWALLGSEVRYRQGAQANAEFQEACAFLNHACALANGW